MSSHLTQSRLHEFLKGKEGKEMLEQDGLRRSLLPNQRWAEAKSSYPIVICRQWSLLRPLGTISTREGYLFVQHLKDGAQRKKLTDFAQKLGKEFHLQIRESPEPRN